MSLKFLEMKRLQNVLLIIIFSGLWQFTQAQSQEKIYSLLIMNFAKGIQWPGVHSGGKFVIGILEYPPLAAELKNSAQNISINGSGIEVKEFEHAEDIQGCNILFIPAYKSKKLPVVLNKFPSEPTLMVSNNMDFARNGGGINFVLVNGKLKYEINCKAIEKRGMKISSNVKGMGIVLE
jgi:hypothetical protein